MGRANFCLPGIKGEPVAASLPDPVPHGYFRRWIEGSDFSLEANTVTVPSSDHFYVLEAGEIRLGTTDFHAATALYESLCVAYWEGRLTSDDLPTRLQAARGLFRHDHEHPSAGELLTRCGDERDRSMVGKARQRAAFLRRQRG
jgi:hypothetical protein